MWDIKEGKYFGGWLELLWIGGGGLGMVNGDENRRAYCLFWDGVFDRFWDRRLC